MPEKQIEVKENKLIATASVDNKENKPPEKEKTITNLQKTDKYVKENNFLYFVAGFGVGLILSLILLFFLYRPKKKKLPDLYPTK